MKFSTTTTRRVGYSKGFFQRALIVCVLAFAITSTAGLEGTNVPPLTDDMPTETPTKMPTKTPTEAPPKTPTEAPITKIPPPPPQTDAPTPLPASKSSSSSKSGSGSGEHSLSPTTPNPNQKTPAPSPTPTTTTNTADTTLKPNDTSSLPGTTTDAQDGSKSGSNENTIVLFVMGGIGVVCVIGLIMMFVLRRRSKNNREDELETSLPYRSSSFQMEPRDGYAAYSTAAKAANPVQGHNPQGLTSPSIPKGAIGVRNSAVLLDKTTRSSSLSLRLSSGSILRDTRTGSELHRFGPNQFSLRGGSDVSELTGTSSMTDLDRPSNFSVDSRLSLDSTSTYNHGGNGMGNRFSTTSSLTDHDAIDFGINSVSFISTEHSQPLELNDDDIPDLPRTAEDRESYEL